MLMVKIPNMYEENVQYELVPNEDNEEQWDIRIKQGEFIETILNFGTVRMNEKTGMMNYDFNIKYTPDDELDTDNVDLQREAGKILESVMIGFVNNNE